jgi:hypothetical protein
MEMDVAKAKTLFVDALHHHADYYAKYYHGTTTGGWVSLTHHTTFVLRGQAILEHGMFVDAWAKVANGVACSDTTLLEKQHYEAAVDTLAQALVELVIEGRISVRVRPGKYLPAYFNFVESGVLMRDFKGILALARYGYFEQQAKNSTAYPCDLRVVIRLPKV